MFLFLLQLIHSAMRNLSLLHRSIAYVILITTVLHVPWGVTGEASPFSHQIDLSFDLSKSLLRATSRIDVPAAMPLSLEFGPLTVTGAMVEPQGQTFKRLIPQADNVLRVPASSRQQQILVSYELHLPPGGQGDNIINKKAIALAGFWHPRSSHKMHYTLVARIPDNFSAIAESETIESHMEKSIKVVRLVSPTPLQAMHFIAAPYQIQTIKVGNIDLSTYFFHEDGHLAKAYLEDAKKYLSMYQQEIGPYPYTHYAIVENVLSTGYGFPGFTLLGQQVIRLPFIRSTSLGHEILHSWFGNSVFVDMNSGNWAEGLTSYLADHQYAAHAGQDKQYRKNQLLRYNAYIPEKSSLRLNDFRNTNLQTVSGERNRAIGYNKGTLFFHMLRKEIGEKNFQTAVRQLYNDHIFTDVSWETLKKLFSKVSGKKLDTFFEQWLDSEIIPNLHLQNAQFEHSQTGFTVTCTIQQEIPFQITVPIEITTTLGPATHIVYLDKKEQTFTIPVKALPLAIAVDPHYDLVRQLEPEETPPLLAHIFASNNLQVLIAPEIEDKIKPLTTYFQTIGTVLKGDQVSNSDLQDNDWVFIGDSAPRQSIFGIPNASTAPVHIETHQNPLAPRYHIMTVDISDATGIERIVRLLSHYQKYSSLDFINGRIQQKSIKPSEDGIRGILLPTPTALPATATLPFNEFIKQLKDARVTYIGETHDNYAHHLLQLRIIQTLHARYPGLAIGLEMFPASVQPVLDAYIQGDIHDEADFVEQSAYHESWGYDYRLYRDIFTYARTNAIPLIGLNIPKNITETVFRTGSTDTLQQTDQHLLPAFRSLVLPGYIERLEPYFNMHLAMNTNGRPGFLQAQAIWDETMAENITKYLKKHPDSTMVVLAGTGHVNKMNAIPPRVYQRMGAISQYVVAPLSQQQSIQPGWCDFFVAVEPLELPPAGKLGVVLNRQDNHGLKIEQISPHGKAGLADVQKGDTICRINGVPIQTVGMLRFHLMDLRPGDTVQLELERQNKKISTEIELTSGAQGMMPLGHPK
ncbi:ChaN family lipoprotein [Desulfogranum japonicum]|uniref:ChaN family lipoprotein n=1 Tax=Desulfogranum japonicum TaxID=231447 RepID=UPI00041C3869|nr:ChaN family lipoprotein [Desulfogranum japonicum]